MKRCWIVAGGVWAGAFAPRWALAQASQPAPNASTSALFDTLGPPFRSTPLLNWGALLGCIFAGVLVGRLIKGVLDATGKRLRDNPRGAYRGLILQNAASPLSLVILGLALHFGLGLLHGLTPELNNVVFRAMRLLYIVAGGWFAYNLVDLIDLWLTRITARTATKLDDMAVPLIRKTLRIFIVIILGLMIAQNVFGLDVTSWLATLGVVGLAVSLAAQDSIRNMFGSLTVFFDQPFKIGDRILFDGQDGVVEEIGFRSTRLRKLSGELVYVPNMKFIDNNVVNITAQPFIEHIFDLNLRRDLPPEKVAQAVEIVRGILNDPEFAQNFNMKGQSPQVFWTENKIDNLTVKVWSWFIIRPGKNWWEFCDHRHRLHEKIFKALTDAGVQFAFPTQMGIPYDATQPVKLPAKPAGT